MSDFFKSPVVRAAMAEIQELQEDLMDIMTKQGFDPYSPFTKHHLNTMRKLVDKQKNFMFRLSLEKDDPDAKEMREQALKSAEFLGLKPNQNVDAFFDHLSDTLNRLEGQISDFQSED